MAHPIAESLLAKMPFAEDLIEAMAIRFWSQNGINMANCYDAHLSFYDLSAERQTAICRMMRVAAQQVAHAVTEVDTVQRLADIVALAATEANNG